MINLWFNTPTWTFRGRETRLTRTPARLNRAARGSGFYFEVGVAPFPVSLRPNAPDLPQLPTSSFPSQTMNGGSFRGRTSPGPLQVAPTPSVPSADITAETRRWRKKKKDPPCILTHANAIHPNASHIYHHHSQPTADGNLKNKLNNVNNNALPRERRVKKEAASGGLEVGGGGAGANEEL